LQHTLLKLIVKLLPFLGILLLLFGAFITFFIFQRPYAFGSQNIAIDYTAPAQQLDPLAIGMDISAYGFPNAFANDQLEQQRLKTLHVKYMRIDLKYATSGDPTSQIICGAYSCDTRWTGDQWVQAIKATGAQPLILLPYSTTDAANMVKHFNKITDNYVKYWVVGNEPEQAGISAITYSTTFNQNYDAMKAIDPTIKIGGGATAWYDAPFLQTFLEQSGSRVEFVDFHNYAQEGVEPGDYTKLFQSAAEYGDSIHKLRSLIQQIVPARASRIGIEVGEWELNWGGVIQDDTNFHAVWTASALGHIISAGAWALFYADKGNALYMQEHAIIDAHGRVINVNVDDTNPAYHGIGMFTGEGLFRHFGDALVRASSTLPNVEVYASDNPKNIVMINKDPSLSRTANVSLKGVTSGTIDVWRKDGSVPFSSPPIKSGILPLENGAFTCQLPPFSVTTFVLRATPQIMLAASSPFIPSPMSRTTPTAILAHRLPESGLA
jgi:hypothetical protein